MSKGIIVASFGTSYTDAAASLEKIETAIREAYPEQTILRAWTSNFIRKKIQDRDGIHIHDVAEALEAMLAQGINDVVVQPTHIISGQEYDKIANICLDYSSRFHSLKVGKVLLDSRFDYIHCAQAIQHHITLFPDEFLVLMGHGTDHASNVCYQRMNAAFAHLGVRRIFMATVESTPRLEDADELISEIEPNRILLHPFLMVAGDHATNDMAGDDPDSWKSQFEAKGYPVRCILNGLGEYKAFRTMILQHLKDTMERE